MHKMVETFLPSSGFKVEFFFMVYSLMFNMKLFKRFHSILRVDVTVFCRTYRFAVLMDGFHKSISSLCC